MKTPPSIQAGFRDIYVNGIPPWELGRPQAPFVAVADQVTGPLLDVGCGTGNTSLFFAARGLDVTGLDFVGEAIRQARNKATLRGLTVEFLVKDAMTLGTWERRFASIVDSGLFHIYHGDDQRHYVKGLAHVIQPGGRLFLFSFAEDKAKRDDGVTPEELHEIFCKDWDIESIEEMAGELNPAFKAEFPDEYTDGDPKMLFAVIRRKG